MWTYGVKSRMTTNEKIKIDDSVFPDDDVIFLIG